MIKEFIEMYIRFSEMMPLEYKILFNLVFFSFLIVIYSFFAYYSSKFISRRDLFKLNLRKYAASKHPFIEKTLAVLLYILEYIIILPFMVLLWFTFLVIFILFSSNNMNFETILLIGGTLVLSVRIISYVSEDLAEKVSLLMPFVLLANLLVNPDFFSLSNFINNLDNLGSLFYHAVYSIVIIFIIEFFMRMVHLFSTLVKGKEQD